VVMAGKNKDKVDAIGADFKKLNKTMTRQMEAISERLTPDELAKFEEYTRIKLSPLINQLLQSFFSAGGFQSAGQQPDGSTKLTPTPQVNTAAAPAPAATPAPLAPPVSTPKATPVATALGAGATGTPAPVSSPVARPTATPTRAAPVSGDSVQLVVAKAAVDSMADELMGIVGRIRDSDNDPVKLRQINLDYTSINQKHGAAMPKLVEALDAQQKAAFSEYLKTKLMPVSSQLVEAFTAAGAVPKK
ncbi:MAG: hypothetical protein QF464_05470, partial [Myxococcota bacterium]|nr:hypothetical protein [Myxococcota bacterium]